MLPELDIPYQASFKKISTTKIIILKHSCDGITSLTNSLCCRVTALWKRSRLCMAHRALVIWPVNSFQASSSIKMLETRSTENIIKLSVT